MESTYIELQGNLTQEQLKMAVDVLSAIGLNPIVKGSMIELEDWEKNVLAQRIESAKEGNLLSSQEVHQKLNKCFK